MLNIRLPTRPSSPNLLISIGGENAIRSDPAESFQSTPGWIVEPIGALSADVTVDKEHIGHLDDSQMKSAISA
jgi:hypothetical protein